MLLVDAGDKPAQDDRAIPLRITLVPLKFRILRCAQWQSHYREERLNTIKAAEMAIVRCERHPLSPTKLTYGGYVLPIGYPNTAAVCGRVGCEEPGRVWLTSDEVIGHQDGERVFGVKTHSIKVRVGDEIIPT
jgi:hypothetical protein